MFTVMPLNYSGFVYGESALNLATQPSCGTYGTSSSPVGTYASFCVGAVDSNYTISYISGSVTVTQASVRGLAASPVGSVARTLAGSASRAPILA